MREDPNGGAEGDPGVPTRTGFPARLAGRSGWGVGPFEGLADGPEEILAPDGLPQQSVRPETREDLTEVRVIEPATHHENRNVPNLCHPRPVLEETSTVQDRHPEIENDQVCRVPQKPNERLGPVAGLDYDKVLRLEKITIPLADQGIIVDNHDGVLGLHGAVVFLAPMPNNRVANGIVPSSLEDKQLECQVHWLTAADR